MKIFGQLEKAQIENTTSDTAAMPNGMITYRTDTKQLKVSNGTIYKMLIDEDTVQTLSNKIIADPEVTGAILLNQTATPSTPAAGKAKFYYKTDGKLYTLDSAGNEALVGSGSGSGGVANLITTGSADDTASSIFVPYADAAASRPVDGTGGSPTVTTSVSATAPLIGTKSFLLTKGAANVQGQGWAIPFTVNPAYRAKVLTISVDYIVNSGTFVPGTSAADSDVIWYIYDVTNSQLIEPSSIKMLSSSSTISDKFQASFQTSATGSSYRLIAHVATTSAVAYELKVDNVTVSPSNYIFGTPVTDMQTLNGVTSSWTANATTTAKYRRDGDHYEVEIQTAITGTPTAANLTYTLPFSFDTSKMASGANTAFFIDGSSNANRGATGTALKPLYLTTNTILIAWQSSVANAGQSPVQQTSPVTWAAGDFIVTRIRFPAVGLSSSVQMSDQADTRVVDFAGIVTVGTALTANTTNIPLTAEKDSHGAWSGSVFTVPVAGDYLVNAGIQFTTSTSNSIVAYVNGAAVARVGTAYASSVLSGSTALLSNLKVGDTISFRSQNSLTTLAATTEKIWIQRISGPQAIAATESVNLSYGSAAAGTIGTADTLQSFTSKEIDSHGTWSGNNTFTAPITGTYSVAAAILTAGVTLSTAQALNITLYVNGSFYRVLGFVRGNGASSIAYFCTGTDLVKLKAGDTLQIYASSSVATNQTASGGYNKVQITRVGN